MVMIYAHVLVLVHWADRSNHVKPSVKFLWVNPTELPCPARLCAEDVLISRHTPHNCSALPLFHTLICLKGLQHIQYLGGGGYVYGVYKSFWTNEKNTLDKGELSVSFALVDEVFVPLSTAAIVSVVLHHFQSLHSACSCHANHSFIYISRPRRWYACRCSTEVTAQES